jgi:hypothetical protein
MRSRAPQLPRTVVTHLGHDAVLAPLLAKADRLNQLQSALATLVPKELVRDVRIANIRHDSVVVWARTNATAAKLKQLLPTLLRGFAVVAPDVKAVKVEVQFAATFDHSKDLRQRNSTKNVILPPAEPLQKLAASLPESELRKVLERLAAKGKMSNR